MHADESVNVFDISYEDDESIDSLFQSAFESFKMCQDRLEKMGGQSSAVVSAPTPATRNAPEGLVTQGEGSSEVRVLIG